MKTVRKWMRTLPALCLAALMTVSLPSCVKDQSETVSDNVLSSPEVTAVVSGAEFTGTRTYVDETLNVLWAKDDEISVFLKNQENRRYAYTGEGGEASGKFVAADETSHHFFASLEYNYGVYPYLEGTKVHKSGIVSLNIPETQPYCENGFAPGMNVMVAASEDLTLSFKNVCGYVAVKLYGEGVKVKGIVLRGNGEEEVAGEGETTIVPGGVPELSLNEGAKKEVYVEAETPVTLGATEETATEFWFVLAPVTFAQGFSISVIGENGDVLLEQATEKEVQVVRSEVYRMKALNVITEAEASFAADIVWTYELDAEVDHKLFFEIEEAGYSREALALGVDEAVVAKYGDAINATEPEKVTVSTVDPATGEETEVEAPVISNIRLVEGQLVADVVNFEWDKTYSVKILYALTACDLTLAGKLTTVDRSREMVSIPLCEYTFEINKTDAETGFGHVAGTPGYYYWQSEPLSGAIFKAFVEGGVINVNDNVDFAYDGDLEDFSKAELYTHLRAYNMAPGPGNGFGYVTVNRNTAVAETEKFYGEISAQSLKDLSTGEQDPDDPYKFLGKVIYRYITTYIGEVVEIPFRFNYRVPGYDFLHLKYYTFNTQKEYPNFIQTRKFEDNDGSVLWWSLVFPSYFVEPADESKSEYEIQMGISSRYALANFDISYINLAELAFNVVDEQDGILVDEEMEALGLRAKFFYADETLADKNLPTEDQFVPVFQTYKSLWVDNTVLYYRTNEKKFIPVKGSLTIQSDGCDFPIPTRFDTPKASFKYPDAILDYSSFAVVRWTPFKEPVAKGSTIVLDENKLYRVPLFKGMELMDNRPNAVSYYVIEDGEWVKGNVTELVSYSAPPTGGNGYREGVLSKDAYRLTISYDSFLDNVPTDLRKLLSLQFSADGETFVNKQNESGTLTPYVVFDYRSEVQFHGSFTIPVVVYVESPWQEKLTFEYDVTIKGYDAP